MVRLLLYLVPLALAVYALVDCAGTPAAQVRALPRAGWALVILLLPIAGPLLWLAAGRPRGAAEVGWPSSAGGRAQDSGGHGPGRVRGVVAPDDDPEFLAQLDRARGSAPSAGDRERWLRRWEEDLRRREERIRRERGESTDGEGTPPA